MHQSTQASEKAMVQAQHQSELETAAFAAPGDFHSSPLKQLHAGNSLLRGNSAIDDPITPCYGSRGWAKQERYQVCDLVNSDESL